MTSKVKQTSINKKFSKELYGKYPIIMTAITEDPMLIKLIMLEALA